MTKAAPLLPLKACPFCGGPARIKSNKTTVAQCTKCTATCFQKLRDENSAIVQWNHRTPAPSVVDLEEAVQDVMLPAFVEAYDKASDDPVKRGYRDLCFMDGLEAAYKALQAIRGGEKA